MVVEHNARDRYEENLLHFVDTEFVFLEDGKKLQPPEVSDAVTSTVLTVILPTFLAY